MNVSWNNCTQPQDGAVVKDIKWSPNPPILGQDLIVTAKGMLKSETVTNNSYYTLDVKFGYITALNTKAPLCGNSTINLPFNLGLIKLTGLTCPQVN